MDTPTPNPRGTGLKALLRRFDGPEGDERARAMFEHLRWPHGPICPRCGEGNPYVLIARPTSRKPGRKGLYKCRAKGCRRQYTVRVGTIMEDSHIPFGTWMIAFQMLSSNKKGISAHWLHRNLDLAYKSAWFMAHRIREAMKRPPLVGKLTGIVEADETYVGGKPRAYEKRTPGRPGRASKKVPVLSLVQRGGDVRSFPIWDGKVTGNNLKRAIRENVDREADIFTDELQAYQGLRREFGLGRHPKPASDRHLKTGHPERRRRDVDSGGGLHARRQDGQRLEQREARAGDRTGATGLVAPAH